MSSRGARGWTSSLVYSDQTHTAVKASEVGWKQGGAACALVTAVDCGVVSVLVSQCRVVNYNCKLQSANVFLKTQSFDGIPL